MQPQIVVMNHNKETEDNPALFLLCTNNDRAESHSFLISVLKGNYTGGAANS